MEIYREKQYKDLFAVYSQNIKHRLFRLNKTYGSVKNFSLRQQINDKRVFNNINFFSVVWTACHLKLDVNQPARSVSAM